MSEETVTLVNKSRTMQVIVLDHPVFRDKKWGYKVTNAVGGEGTMQRRATPGSLTLMPGGRIEGLPPAIEKVTQVAALLTARPPLVAIEQPKPAAPEPPQEDSSRATLVGERVRLRKKSEG
ncbi:MAG TPA: hypothetical protein VJ777_00310 [Mycobacterium sp.]|nr:hypothetical protein [Mycobacterium sp.]